RCVTLVPSAFESEMLASAVTTPVKVVEGEPPATGTKTATAARADASSSRITVTSYHPLRKEG
ncbi:MAG TPA: hypothetical protein VN971_07615, partial [Thermoanaerobaculia bacterium]|nr:hypothetical protein [Thermoanaerobaculia bacterium]